MPKTTDVRIGAPDQKTTGAIKSAPIGTPLPDFTSISKAGVTLNGAFEGDLFVSEDGLTLTPSVSTSDIKEWSGTTVRKVLESFDGTLGWTILALNEEALKVAFGDDYVSIRAAASNHGKQAKVSLGAHLPKPKSWVFLMKDGDARVVIVVPNGQITEVGEISFNSSSAVGLPVTLSCYPDSTGECIHIYTDDGDTDESDS